MDAGCRHNSSHQHSCVAFFLLQDFLSSYGADLKDQNSYLSKVIQLGRQSDLETLIYQFLDLNVFLLKT